jgi:alpha-tubulin suppressor-like RCC1 family protein
LKREHWTVWLIAAHLMASGGCKRRTPDEASATTAATPSDPNQATQVAIGGSSACAVLASGALQCWGDNSYGQLGDGGRESRLVPGPVPGLTGVVEVDVGDAHACARKRDGTVWCWGQGSDGALGTGSNQNARAPVQVAGVPPAQDIGTSGGNTCMVAVDGGLWCWGSNVFGESAQPAGTRSVLAPTLIAGLGPAAEVETGQNHTCARLRDGTVWCWGYNSSGQVGDGTSVQRNAPAQVLGVAGATSLAVGQSHACALVAGGAVTCWGSPGGAGGGRRATAVALAGVVDLTAGNFSTCAVVAGGVPRCWGNNYEGKFFAPREVSAVNEPTALPGVVGARSVALGIGYQCVLSAAGPLRCWGTLRQPFGSRSVIRTVVLHPVTFDGRCPPPPLVPDPPRGSALAAVGALANAVQGAADAAAQAANAVQAAAPAAPAAPEPLAARAARTTAVVPTPHPVTVGRRTLGAERCVLDGPAILGSSTSTVLPSVAFDRRGALYLVDGEQHLRRYAPVRGDECHFTPDAAFGEVGVLTLPSTVSRVSVDARGAVVASGVLGSFVVEDGAVSQRCNSGSHGYVTMSSRAGEGLGVFPGAPVRSVSYGGSACEITPWAYENAFGSVMAVAFDRRDVVLAGSMPDRGGNFVAVYDAQGHERRRFGNARATEADGFCWVHGVTACDAGYCVVDTNCDRVAMWSRRGEHLGNARASDLLGLQRPWLTAIVAGRREVFIAAGAQREPRAENVAEGVLFRVSGL